MGAISATEVDATRQALIASIVQQTLKQKSILLPTVTDYSSLVGNGQKSVGIPRRTQFAAADKSEETALTAQTITFAADTIDLSKHKAIYATIERIAGIQSNVNVQAQMIQEMANELALQVDKDVYAQLKLASTAAPDHIVPYVSAGVIAVTDIVGARALLNKQNVPMQDRFMVISPDEEANLLKIDNFIRADLYGSSAPVQNGEIGRVFGFTVLMHTSLASDETLFYHKSACGYASQMSPAFDTNKDLKNVQDEYLMHVLYGVKVLDSGKRQVLYNTSGS